MILIQPGYCDLAVLMNLPLFSSASTGAASPSPACPEHQPSPHSTATLPLVLSLKFITNLHLTNVKCKKPQEKVVSHHRAWEWDLCMVKELQLPRATGRLRREKFEPKFVKWGHIKISNNVRDLKGGNSLLHCSTLGSGLDFCTWAIPCTQPGTPGVSWNTTQHSIKRALLLQLLPCAPPALSTLLCLLLCSVKPLALFVLGL